MNELATTATTPNALEILNRAVDSKMDPSSLERLVALAERMADRTAAQEFHSAMARFKAECPPVKRRTENTQFQVTRNGVRQNRTYASLEDIEFTIRGPLASNGLAYRWGSMSIDGGKMTIACVISHVGGHSVESSVTLPYESKAGCSEQQKVGSAMTYAQRYSLVQALGLTSCDADNDGNDESPETISEEDLLRLEVEADEAGVDKAKLLQWAGVTNWRDIPAHKVSQAFAMIAKKKAAARGAS